MENNELKDFTSNISLINVFMKSLSAECSVIPTSVDPTEIDLSFHFELRFTDIPAAKQLLSFIKLTVVAIHKKDKKENFKIDSIYTLAYEYSQFKGKTSNELFEKFTREIALFGAYPYLREALMSTSTKMGLPPVIAPILRRGKSPANKVAEKKTAIKKIAKK